MGAVLQNKNLSSTISESATCVSVIDVGKGDCILLQVGGQAALIDTGYENTSAKVLSYLRGRGVNGLEFLIITHYDRDHIGGVRAIGESLGIGKAYLPAYEGADKHYLTLMSTISKLGLPTQRVTDAITLKLGNASLSLYPSGVAFVPDAKGDEGNDNDLSIAASLTCGGDSYLFAGDLETDGLIDYLKGKHGQFDVLKAPCHGKKSPYNDEFIEDVRPKLAIITDSAEEPAGKKTLKVLADAGIDVYRSSTDGTIIVEGNGAGAYRITRT